MSEVSDALVICVSAHLQKILYSVFILFVGIFALFCFAETFLSLIEFVSKIIVGVVVVIINYVFSKLIIFKNKEKTE